MNKKLTAIILGVSFIASSALAQQGTNTAIVGQSGGANSTNTAVTGQVGNKNTGVTLQAGGSNAAAIGQLGCDNAAGIGQATTATGSNLAIVGQSNPCPPKN